MRITQEDLVKEIETSNLWRCRFRAALELVKYFHSIVYHDGDSGFDVKKEIKWQSDRLFSQWKKLGDIHVDNFDQDEYPICKEITQ